jgi:CPA2 family monovalent cation:H+ antiporter-2
MHPVRDLFSAVFFVSIGMLIDPALLSKYAVPILAITFVVVLGKVFTCALGSFVAGNDMRTSLRVGMGLAQIGEFSFIIASLGLSLNVTSEFIYPIAVAVSSLTTLLTPYLIRSSDVLVEWFDRVAPKPLLEAIDAYSERVGNLGKQSGSRIERKILGKLGGQIALNLLLIAGIFIAAIFLHRHIQARWPDFPGGEDGTKAATWLTALLLSFPLLVAVWRKIEAGAMLVAETAVGVGKVGSRDSALQAVISSTILVCGTGVLVLLVALLSSTLLPSRNVLLLTLLIVVISSFVLYRGAVRLYSRAQSALRDTFAQPADPPLLQEAPSLPPLLREARLETVEVKPGTEATGKMIAELKLRTQTGASVVGIERHGNSIVNPGPDEELESGDQILLIGSEEQLEAAKKLLTAPKNESP